MKEQTYTAALGCLLHDVGKIVYRSGTVQGDHSAAGAVWLKENGVKSEDILDCVRYHHARQIKNADIPDNSPAYITYIADNISSAADRRTNDETAARRFEKDVPLNSIFTHMNGEHAGRYLEFSELDGKLRMPVTGSRKISPIEYEAVLNKLSRELKATTFDEDWMNSLLTVLEGLTSKIPSSTNTEESVDISLYNHLKTTSAAGVCISEYLLENEICDYRTELFENEKDFRKKKAFILFSADFSGIQNFIFTVTTKNALKSLRSRSFFLEMTMEHFIDELLTACGVCRTNLLYSGGGHCYILLPNTEKTADAIEKWTGKFNKWLTENFGTSLYLASGYTECSPNDLTNTPAEDEPYKAMFRRVSQEISKKKMSRYTASQIIFLNKQLNEDEGRECRVCGRSDKLIKDKNGDTYSCSWCHTFESLSEKIIDSEMNVYLVLNRESDKADFCLPGFEGAVSFIITNEYNARKALFDDEDVVRIYTKNAAYSGLKYSTKLYIGDYSDSSSMQDLAEQSMGVKRLAVCRMDVDDLGQAFIAGFEKKNSKSPSEKNHYVTISRTSQFSSEMSLFFKLYINSILDGSFRNRRPLHVTVVYSGGDDVFLAGAWGDVIEAAERIHDDFMEYNCGSLTISGGIGIFDDNYPIRLAANETAELEDSSKKLPSKDAVSLFEPGTHTYCWKDFEDDIEGIKLEELQYFFDDNENQRGNSFLYKLVELLRDAETNGKLPLARFAYILARLEPSKKSDLYQGYKAFEKNMYSWALDKEERRKLLTAIYIYVYSKRGGKD